MESQGVTSSKSFLFIIVGIILVISGIGIFYVITLPAEVSNVSLNKTEITLVTNNSVDVTEEGGHISGILKGPVIVNITEIP